jgi:hypothetical protein
MRALAEVRSDGSRCLCGHDHTAPAPALRYCEEAGRTYTLQIVQEIFVQELKTGKKPEAEAILRLVDTLNLGLKAPWSEPIVPSELRSAIGVILRDVPQVIERLTALRPMMSTRLADVYRALLQAATAAQSAGGGSSKPNARRSQRSHRINQEHRNWRFVFHAVEKTLRDAGRRTVGIGDEGPPVRITARLLREIGFDCQEGALSMMLKRRARTARPYNLEQMLAARRTMK